MLIRRPEGDRESFVSQEPDWLPSPPTFVGADERRSRAMTDLPHFAGVHA